MVGKSKWLEDEEEWLLPTLRQKSVDCSSSGHGFSSSLFPGIHAASSLHNTNNHNDNISGSNTYSSNISINIDRNNYSGNYINNNNNNNNNSNDSTGQRNSLNSNINQNNTSSSILTLPATICHISSDGSSWLHVEKEKGKGKGREKEKEREREMEKENDFYSLAKRKSTSPRNSSLTPPHSNQSSRHSLLLALPDGHSSSFSLPNLPSARLRYVRGEQHRV